MNSKIDSQKLTHLNASRHHSDRINYYYTVMVLKTQFSFVIIFTPQKPEVPAMMIYQLHYLVSSGKFRELSLCPSLFKRYIWPSPFFVLMSNVFPDIPGLVSQIEK